MGYSEVMHGRHVSWMMLFSLLIGSISGCSSPALNADRYALDKHFTKQIITGQDFSHVIYQKKRSTGDRWHIYIEGDGRPWIAERYVAQDPTSKHSLMLKLMNQDPGSSLYLGRPCYYGMTNEPGCTPWLWTHGRYSEPVISSMVSALNKLVQSNQIKKITLIGHSGGGTLAVLMAEQLKEVDTVITLAGNLDVGAWAEQHGYTRLKGSLNPAERNPLPLSIHEYHFLGDKDPVIPRQAISRYVNKRPSACLTITHDCTHQDCWEKEWSVILKSIANGKACQKIK